jgi:hypothetical protein
MEVERLKDKYPELWERFRDKFEVINPPISGSESSHKTAVWWVSGSMAYLDSLSLPDNIPHIFWLSKPGRRWQKSDNGIVWRQITHSWVGGPTKLKATFGSRWFAPLDLPNELQRCLNHVIKFSIRPTPCSPDTTVPHYTLNDRLSLGLLDKPILYPTYMSRTGWGIRPLDPSELAACFDLPADIKWDPSFGTTIVPLHFFRAVIDFVLNTLPNECPLAAKRQKLVDVPSISPADGVWLPSLGAWLSGSWADVDIANKAVKADDAPVDTRPWRKRVAMVLPCLPHVLDVMERLCMRKWRALVITSFFTYLRSTYGDDWFTLLRPKSLDVTVVGIKKRSFGTAFVPSSVKGGDHHSPTLLLELAMDVEKGLRVLGQIIRSTWWEWTHGSSLLFWRWNGAEQVRAARDGMSIHVLGSLSRVRRGRATRFTPAVKILVASKVQTMVDRTYLEPGRVSSLLNYFAVPKGDSDIRVVYDGTLSGLNKCLWCPNFFLPSARHAGELLNYSTWMADMDFGEFFHNFHMDERIRRHSGVAVSTLHLKQLPAGSNCSLRWARLFMGMRPSPYNAVRHYYWAEEFARGNPSTASNPMGYDSVILNLPGSPTYDPNQPKVMKWKTAEQCIAGDVITFVDDVRITASSKEACWSVYRQFASRIQFLGMQNAPRKFRPPSQDQAGAWTGTIFRIDSGAVSKTVSQEKWSKGRDIIQDLLAKWESSERPMIDRKELERHTGFLNHLAMTFEDLNPFLKGFYLTLNSWRPGRDHEGWKISAKVKNHHPEDSYITSADDLEISMNEGDDGGAPKLVQSCIRLKGDIGAIAAILKPEAPPVINLRSKTIVTVVYGFGDASGSGLGSTFTCGSGFTYRIGVWGSDDSSQSSNWKEFCNIVTALEDEAEAGTIADSEIFVFTDNSTVESCCVRGTSSSPKLLALVIQLRALTTKFSLKINVFHVAGTRMIEQGTDGVSRGFLGGGVMAGEAMTSFIPIHLGALERHPPVSSWIRSWSTDSLIELSPRNWFEEGHDIQGWTEGQDGFSRPILAVENVYLWAPPPFAADIAMAEMRKARIKRQTSSHIFVCPRLCSSIWVRQLHKAADFVMEVPAGQCCWPQHLHEPLIIGILFPFLRSSPWQVRNTPKMHSMGSRVRRVFKEEEMDSRDLLRKFWSDTHRLRNLPENVVRKLLYFSS